MNKDKINIFFISGTGRCGTNITKKILSLHPNTLSFPFEYRFSIDPFGLIDAYNSLNYNWTPYNASKTIAYLENLLYTMGKRNWLKLIIGKVIKKFDSKGRFFAPPPYFDWNLEKWFPNYKDHVDKLINNIIDYKYNGNWPGAKGFKLKNKIYFSNFNKDLIGPFRNFYRELIKDLLIFNNKTHFVEDNTWSILFAKELLEILPEAKFIHVIRHPFDVVASLMNQKWAPSKLNNCIDYYSSIMNKIICNSKFLNKKNLLELKLEHIVNNKEKTFNLLCDFLNIPYKNELKKINLTKSNIGRWKNDFNNKEKIVLRSELLKFINLYNY